MMRPETSLRTGATAVLLVLALTLVLPADSTADEEWIRTTGDILQIALPVIGGGSTFFTNPEPGKSWDKEGTRQAVYAYGSAWGTTYALKLILSKARPNGDNRTSFPSGHTMSAFAGAAFIDGRYGKTFGIPALALAAFTGYSRVQSQWHYQDDVIAGASIGMMYAWHFVTPQPGKVSLLPTVGAQGVGLAVTVGADRGRNDPVAEAAPRRSSYDFAFGPAFLLSNKTSSLGDGGTLFELGDLEGNNDPTTTAALTVGIPTSERGRITFMYGPFEARDRGTFSQDVNFGGNLYTAGTPVFSAWRFYDLRAHYQHTVLDEKRWGVNLGAGLGLMYSYVAMESQDKQTSSFVDDQTAYPYLYGALEHRFKGRVRIEGSVEGMSLNDDWIFDATLALKYQASRAWDFALGYTYFTRKITTDTLFNEVRYSVPTLSVTRFW